VSTPASMHMLQHAASGRGGAAVVAAVGPAAGAVAGGGVGCVGGDGCGGCYRGDGGGRRALFFSLSFRLLTLFRSFLYTL